MTGRADDAGAGIGKLLRCRLEMTAGTLRVIRFRGGAWLMTAETGVIPGLEIFVVAQHIRGEAVVMTLAAADSPFIAGLGSGVTLPAGFRLAVVGTLLMALQAVAAVKLLELTMLELSRIHVVIMTLLARD